jgi:hypothetical protein
MRYFLGENMRAIVLALFLIIINIPKNIEAKEMHLDLPGLVDFSEVIVYGRLSLGSNLENKKRSDGNDVIDFFVTKIFKGSDDGTTLAICNFPPTDGTSWVWNFRRSKGGWYVFFLIKRPWDGCYIPLNINPMIEVKNSGKTVITEMILDEPMEQSMEDFIKKIMTEIKKHDRSLGNLKIDNK